MFEFIILWHWNRIGLGGMAVMDNEDNEDNLKTVMKMNVKNKNTTWKHEHD